MDSGSRKTYKDTSAICADRKESCESNKKCRLVTFREKEYCITNYNIKSTPLLDKLTALKEVYSSVFSNHEAKVRTAMNSLMKRVGDGNIHNPNEILRLVMTSAFVRAESPGAIDSIIINTKIMIAKAMIAGIWVMDKTFIEFAFAVLNNLPVVKHVVHTPNGIMGALKSIPGVKYLVPGKAVKATDINTYRAFGSRVLFGSAVLTIFNNMVSSTPILGHIMWAANSMVPWLFTTMSLALLYIIDSTLTHFLNMYGKDAYSDKDVKADLVDKEIREVQSIIQGIIEELEPLKDGAIVGGADAVSEQDLITLNEGLRLFTVKAAYTYDTSRAVPKSCSSPGRARRGRRG